MIRVSWDDEATESEEPHKIKRDYPQKKKKTWAGKERKKSKAQDFMTVVPKLAQGDVQEDAPPTSQDDTSARDAIVAAQVAEPPQRKARGKAC